MFISVLAAGGFLMSSIVVDRPFLSPMFGDHMVLQRGKKNTFWGWGTRYDQVVVTIGNKSVRGEVDASGRWMVKIDPPKAGGPYEVKIEGEETVVLKDVLVGDVWLCSGQSNMEFGLSQSADGAEAVKAASHPLIRTFMVGRQVGFEPEALLQGEWRECTPENIVKDGWGGFSAVGYYFGRKVQESTGIPVGLVMSSWGGTSAEAWTGRSEVAALDDWDGDLNTIDRLLADRVKPLGTYLDLWMRENDAVAREGSLSPADLEFDDSSWTQVEVPDGVTQFLGSGGRGLVWLRKEFVLPEKLPEGRATLHLGNIRNLDWTWVNGKQLGFMGWDSPRDYWCWPGSLQPGRNVLTVRVVSHQGQGGFLGSTDEMFLELGDGSRIRMAGGWKGALGTKVGAETVLPRNMEVNPTVPTTLFNGMIAPVAPLAMSGAIWYQGETNAGRGEQYRKLLPAMISSWRKEFVQGDFPFYIVSLANFGERQNDPGDDWWAELREAQDMTARTVKNSGLAVTIDVGEGADVHPKDKKSVGERLALIALAKNYGRKIEYSGPLFQRMRKDRGAIRVVFDHAAGLTSQGELKGFAVAGMDRKWHWAAAQIVGNSVIVSSPSVPDPWAVRYAWGMNPEATLYNSAGLPAVPFRTDDWPMLSAGKQ